MACDRGLYFDPQSVGRRPVSPILKLQAERSESVPCGIP